MKDYKEEIINVLTEACEKARKEGYEKARKETLELDKRARDIGRNEAWECARKLVLPEEDAGFSCDELQKIFHCSCYEDVFEKFSAFEAITKITEYEKKGIRIGTKIRTIKSTDNKGLQLFPVGTIGVIMQIKHSLNQPYLIEAQNEFWWYSRDMFEVIPECSDDEIKIGDEIICPGTGTHTK